MTLICPNHKDCEIYNNWVEQTGREKIDIISKREGSDYYCLALYELRYSKVKAGANLTKKFQQTRKRQGCLNIELLNK